MKKNFTNIFVLLALFIITINLSAQEKLKGNKVVITEDRNISNFNKIEIKGNIDVILSHGENQSVSVETDENLQQNIHTEVHNDVLTILIAKKIIRKKTLVIYIIINKDIEEIKLKDKTKIKSDNTLSFDDITINALGSSKINLDIKSEKLTLNNNENANINLSISSNYFYLTTNTASKTKLNLSSNTVEISTHGSSTIELSGECQNLVVDANNKSNIKANEFECKESMLTASDDSKIYINVDDSITISAINSAEVFVYGNPQIIVEKFSDKAIIRKK